MVGVRLHEGCARALLHHFPNRVQRGCCGLVATRAASSILDPTVLLRSRSGLTRDPISPRVSRSVVRHFRVVRVRGDGDVCASQVGFLRGRLICDEYTHYPIRNAYRGVHPYLLLGLRRVVLRVHGVLSATSRAKRFSQFVMRVHDLSLRVPRAASYPCFHLL